MVTVPVPAVGGGVDVDPVVANPIVVDPGGVDPGVVYPPVVLLDDPLVVAVRRKGNVVDLHQPVVLVDSPSADDDTRS